MKILILGGTKFIGPYVVESLNNQGHEVTIFTRRKTQYAFTFSPQRIIGDRDKLLDFKQLFVELAFDVVIDMIAYSEDDAKQLIRTFDGLIDRIVVVSSCDVYRAYDRLWNVITDKIIPVPLNESSELRTHYFPYRKGSVKEGDWEYDYDKVLVEKTIQSASFYSTILRLPMVYGPGDYYRIYPYLKCMDNNEPILLDENKAGWRFCRGYVEDVANGIALAALDKRSGNYIYNVGESYTHTEREWIELIGQFAGCKNEIITMQQTKLPIRLYEPLAWEQDITLDTSLIRKELNYTEYQSTEGKLKKSIAWLRTNKKD